MSYRYTTEYIRDFNGKILGMVETMSNGDKRARDFDTRMILGYYRANIDRTTDFNGVTIARGDAVVSLIYNKKR